jgi:hypothetical protein
MRITSAIITSVRMNLDGGSASEMEDYRRQQAQVFRSDVKIRPAPSSRRSNSNAWTDEQIEQLRLQLLKFVKFLTGEDARKS